jgi:hypothetical protein
MEYVYPTLNDWGAADLQLEKNRHVEYLQKWVAFKKKNGSNIHMKHSTSAKYRDSGSSKQKPWECTIHEGEMIYFPDGWHHATINLERYTVFVSSFTSEHK